MISLSFIADSKSGGPSNFPFEPTQLFGSFCLFWSDRQSHEAYPITSLTGPSSSVRGLIWWIENVLSLIFVLFIWQNCWLNLMYWLCHLHQTNHMKQEMCCMGTDLKQQYIEMNINIKKCYSPSATSLWVGRLALSFRNSHREWSSSGSAVIVIMVCIKIFPYLFIGRLFPHASVTTSWL